MKITQTDALTITKYAGFHTQWLGFIVTMFISYTISKTLSHYFAVGKGAKYCDEHVTAKFYVHFSCGCGRVVRSSSDNNAIYHVHVLPVFVYAVIASIGRSNLIHINFYWSLRLNLASIVHWYKHK